MMVKRGHVLILLLFVLFIAEGTILPWLIPVAWQFRFSPNLTFVIILFVAVYYSRHTALVLGIVFGMLHDVIFYGSIIGVYSFSMGLSAYVMGMIFHSPRALMPMMMSVVLLGSLLLDSTIFSIYQIFQLKHQSFDWALVEYMVPDLFLHFVFALLVYVPVRKQLDRLEKRVQNKAAA